MIGWVCRYNVGRGPQRGEGYAFNVAYQLTLGPDAWPVLLHVAETAPGGVRFDLRFGLREVARIERPRLAQVDWREQQFRRDRGARELFAWAGPLGELTDGERESAIIKDYYSTLRELGMLGRSR